MSTPIKGHPSYQDRFQVHRDVTPPERTKGNFFMAEVRLSYGV
jgi:hypothetical protein